MDMKWRTMDKSLRIVTELKLQQSTLEMNSIIHFELIICTLSVCISLRVSYYIKYILFKL